MALVFCIFYSHVLLCNLGKGDTVHYKLLKPYRFEVQGSRYKGIKPMNIKVADYKIVAHQDVFLLMPQNDEAVCYLENYKESNFSKNGGLIMVREYLKDWIEHFKNEGWEISN